MIFVSNFNNYKILVQRDITRRVPTIEGDDQGWERVVVRPQIFAEFRSPGHLTYNQRRQALDFFDQRDTGEDQMPPGPYRTTAMASDPDFEGFFYQGSDHWLMFSVLNTETDCPSVDGMDPSEVRALVEKTLLACQQLGQDYIQIEVETTPAPWDTYEEMHHTQIAKACKLLKKDPLAVIAYEKEREKPRDSVIVDLEALIAETAAEQASIDALTVRG